MDDVPEGPAGEPVSPAPDEGRAAGVEDGPASGPGTLAWTEAYYLFTPAFALADGIAGANVRAAAFDDSPGIRCAYYTACMGWALLIHVRPRWAAAVTLAESTVNVGALIVSMMLTYLGLIATLDAPGGGPLALDLELVANFAIAGTAGAIVFYQSLYRVERRLGG